MKPTLLRLSALILTFSVGIAIALFFKSHRSNESRSLAVANVFSSRYPSTNVLIGRGGYLVISVPNDDEFYIGKSKVALCEISARVGKSLGNESLDDRVVFIKGAPSVRFETLSLIIGKIREADVDRIEFFIDKKKRFFK